MARVPADLEKDCVLLYDEQDSEDVKEFVEEIEEYLKNKCSVGVPQRDCVPGTNVKSSENAAISNTGEAIVYFLPQRDTRMGFLLCNIYRYRYRYK